jgi:hypothetical protein
MDFLTILKEGFKGMMQGLTSTAADKGPFEKNGSPSSERKYNSDRY